MTLFLRFRRRIGWKHHVLKVFVHANIVGTIS